MGCETSPSRENNPMTEPVQMNAYRQLLEVWLDRGWAKRDTAAIREMRSPNLEAKRLAAALLGHGEFKAFHRTLGNLITGLHVTIEKSLESGNRENGFRRRAWFRRRPWPPGGRTLFRWRAVAGSAVGGLSRDPTTLIFPASSVSRVSCLPPHLPPARRAGKWLEPGLSRGEGSPFKRLDVE
jgi:hypothetical protein